MPRKGRRPARSLVFRRWLAVGALVLIALLYYRPLKAYIDARGQLAEHRHVVQSLRADKLRLEHRLGSSTSIARRPKRSPTARKARPSRQSTARVTRPYGACCPISSSRAGKCCSSAAVPPAQR